jgi:DNA-binding transcriptional LysR family regulator
MIVNTRLFDGMVIFVDVVNSGSFTKSAQNSGHSTSYISKEINQLEERLGVRLLHRTTRSLRLTAEGELYFQQCQQIINDTEQAVSALSGHQSEPKGVLRISCPVNFGLSRLRALLPEFTELYPLVDLELDLSDKKVDMIAEGYDVLIRASGELQDSSLISRRLMRSYGVTLASPTYLEKFGVPAEPSDLAEHRCITYSHMKNANVWHFTGADNEEIQVQIRSRVITNSAEMELSLCLAGLGITRLPRFNLNDEIENGKLVELFEDLAPTPIDIFLVYPSRKHMSSKVRCFIDFMMEAF